MYFDSFATEYIPQEALNKIKGKSITRNIFRIQFDNSAMCGFYCISFIEYIFTGKTSLQGHRTNSQRGGPDEDKKSNK